MTIKKQLALIVIRKSLKNKIGSLIKVLIRWRELGYLIILFVSFKSTLIGRDSLANIIFSLLNDGLRPDMLLQSQGRELNYKSSYRS